MAAVGQPAEIAAPRAHDYAHNFIAKPAPLRPHVHCKAEAVLLSLQTSGLVFFLGARAQHITTDASPQASSSSSRGLFFFGHLKVCRIT
jgi:hypothetical protein